MSCTRKEKEREWRRGYWNDPTWKAKPLEPGKDNEVTRKYKEHLAVFRDCMAVRRQRATTFDDLIAKQEALLEQMRVHSKEKRDAWKTARH